MEDVELPRRKGRGSTPVAGAVQAWGTRHLRGGLVQQVGRVAVANSSPLGGTRTSVDERLQR